ncbi:protein phosphatase 1 regulatory subunit 12A isoform X8 [Anopheles stephensi]|uniref:protein phosphatase 1 regulatory subunit 12A isoform X8 n=1 Tax=Anopheles stephensi TaxID=30069 RepID=UPI0016587DBD|nr:protein phosphatase 1 regulatory subunit 12A isoform X8 [Anopheles stephensi]
MSLDNRNTSAQFKRAEQLKRWEESEMNKKLSGVPKSPSSRRIKFSSGCIFLAACVAGDKEEVEWLLKNGADIDTANVDGLTALHQACIDDNLDMVEFLVQKGADVNRKDNEGWTPLHATASCGFLSIARYLIENGADLASINSDGELAVDLASSDAMEDLIQHHLDEQGIDCDEARQAEERIMLSDATKWLRTDSSDCDKAHPKTGATAIHVAAAKGYIGVLKLLLEGRGDIDRQDVDGWTPLHAAAYWGQKEATQMLLNASADIDIQNYSGQLAIDIAQDDIVPLLKDARKNVKRTKRRPPSHGNRITDNFETSTETPTKVIRVEMKPIDSNKEKEEVSEKENKPTEPDVILRRTQSFESDEKFYQRYAELRARIQANSCPHTILPSTPINTKTSTASNNNNNNNSSNTNNNNNNNTTTTTASAPASNISSYLVQRSASLKDHRTLRKTASNLVLGSTTTSPSSATPTTTTTTTTGPASGVPTNTSIVPPATGTTTAVSQATGNTTVSSGAVSSPPTSPSGTPTTTPTAGQIRSSIPTPVTTTSTTTNNNKNIMLNSNTDNSSSTPFGDRYRKRYEDQPEVVRKPPQTNNHNNNSTIADHHTTTTSVAGDVLPTTGSGGGGNNATTTAATTGTDTSKNHSLFELNRKYIEQAQKTKINNERNKFLSSLNEKRQQQLQEQQGQSGGGTAGRTEATQAQASIEEPAEVKLIIATSTAAAPTPPTVDAHNATATTPVTISPSSNKLSPGNIFKNFFKSFVPPTRDEESETQRKAHAKRVRETRRSTQGVTLDEIKSAEQLVKKKNASGAGNENDTMASATSASTTTTTSSSPSSLSSSASPSFTTNNATTISGTAAINDRVPSVGDSTDQQQSGGGGNHVSEGSGKDSGSEVAVSASFTIAAPSSALDDGGDGGGGGGHRRHRRSVGAGGGNDEEEDDIKVSYTISAPVRPSSPGRRATVNNSKESTTDPPAAAGSDILGGTDADVPVVSATFHVPAVSEAGVVATTATIRTSGTAAGGVVSSSDSNTTTITNTTSASSNTNHNTAATYTKRSLFDIDNANSLTLAEKLRHEANKYAIAAVADGDLDSHSAVPRVPNSNSTTTNSGGESNSNSTNAPADNSAVSAAAAAAVPPSPTLRKAADSGAASTTTGVTAERRPSWRLKVDGGSKFKLEDASTPNAATQSSSVASGSVYESVPATQATEHGLTTTKLTSSSALAQRRAQQQNGDSTTTTTTTGSSVAGSAIGSRPLSASGLAAGEQYNRVPGSNASSAGEPTTAANSGTDTSPLHHLRRPPKSTTAGEENKENDKENDSRTSSTTAQATQAVIQRRRRQKRRSTGVVSVGIEDLDPDRQDSPVDGEDKETGSERGRSRVGSTASELDTANQPQDSTRENGGDCIDYKALYEQEKADNDKLKMSLRKKDEEVVTLKAALDRFTTATTKNNSLSELEKRERRAMERKMSEMEEELKLLQKYKTENERLRAENRALTRVVSKLTTSAQNQVHAAAANKQ